MSANLKHVMISYEQGIQREVTSLKQRLERMGHTVWIDFERGSTGSAIMRAIEEAYIVIIALTEGYEKSDKCRREFEYADDKGKEIIPVIIATNYRPKDWIKFLVGNNYVYNCMVNTENEKFEKKLQEKVNKPQGKEMTVTPQLNYPNTSPPPYSPREEKQDDDDSGRPTHVNIMNLMLAGMLGGLANALARPIHRGVNCDGCGEDDISGTRYKCCVCSNYDLCESCHSKPRIQVHDRSHLFMKFKKPQNNAQTLVGLTRQAAVKFSQKVDTSSNVHPIQCNKCKRHPIIGRRFLCLVCDDFDLCMSCEENSRSFHDEDHPMVVFCYPASSDDQAAQLVAALLLASLI